jgi:hypothetical protein
MPGGLSGPKVSLLHKADKFWQLVEEQHTQMRQRHFAVKKVC